MNIAKIKCAVELIKLAIEFQEYRQEHPATKKLPSDELFRHIKHEQHLTEHHDQEFLDQKGQ